MNSERYGIANSSVIDPATQTHFVVNSTPVRYKCTAGDRRIKSKPRKIINEYHVRIKAAVSGNGNDGN
jgi:hypothetical protein